MDYTDASKALDKLRHEMSILNTMSDRASEPEPTPMRLEMLASQSKRVRTASNLVVRAFARLRDHATAQEGTST